MIIRQATKDDLGIIVKVHKACFPNSFSTQLGDLLVEFYEEYMLDNPDLFIVSVDETLGAIAGFCMGYLCEKSDHIQLFVRHNRIRFCLRCLFLAITGNKPFYKKVAKVFGRKKQPPVIVDDTLDQYSLSDKADLLSICVLAEYRGRGLANSMMEHYLNVLEQKGRRVCLLSVDPKNPSAIKLYEKNGFRLHRRSEETFSYAKIL